jgi:hypothetical protein
MNGDAYCVRYITEMLYDFFAPREQFRTRNTEVPALLEERASTPQMQVSKAWF